MNWLGLVFGILLVGVVVYLMNQNKKRKNLGGKELVIKGFTKIGYNLNQISAIEVDRLGAKLHKIAERAWPAMERIYGDQAEMYIKHIRLDTTFLKVVKEGNVVITRKAIELTMPGNTIIMRPQGSGGHSAEFWFALELLNLYRGTVFGIDKIKLAENASDEEMKLWKAAQRACKDAV